MDTDPHMCMRHKYTKVHLPLTIEADTQKGGGDIKLSCLPISENTCCYVGSLLPGDGECDW